VPSAASSSRRRRLAAASARCASGRRGGEAARLGRRHGQADRHQVEAGEVLGQQGVEVLDNLALDLVAESAQQEAKFGVELERVGHHLERARDARALEGDFVHAGAFLIGAFHAEFVFDLLGPGVCHLARGGMAEMVLAVDVDVGHGFTPSARAGALHGTGPPIG
jgi:hypothetical protein